MENDLIEYNLGSGDLGDQIFVTPIFKGKKGKIIIPNAPEAIYTAQIFEGLAEVEVRDNVDNQINDWSKIEHKSERIIRWANSSNNAIPFLLPNMDRVKKMNSILSRYTKPVIIQFTTKPFEWSRDIFATYRNLPDDLIPFVISSLRSKGYTPINLVRPNRPYKYVDGVEFLQNIDLLDFIAACHVSKRYVGIDCGALHAALAVGSKIIGLIPPSNDMVFPHGCYVWREDMFINEPIRAKYLEFKNILANFNSSINFIE